MLTMAEAKREHDRVFQMRVSDSFLTTLDDWRRGQPDLPSRAEAVRRLVEIAVELPSLEEQKAIVQRMEKAEGAN